MIRGVHHIALHTPDLERLVRFYRDVFGFEVVDGSAMHWSDSPEIDAITGVPKSAARTMMLRAANIYIEFFQYSSPAPRSQDRLRPSDYGYTHLCFDVDDIFAEYERLSKNGMRFSAPPLDGGGIKSVYGKDPDGNVVEIQQLDHGHIICGSKLRGKIIE